MQGRQMQTKRKIGATFIATQAIKTGTIAGGWAISGPEELDPWLFTMASCTRQPGVMTGLALQPIDWITVMSINTSEAKRGKTLGNQVSAGVCSVWPHSEAAFMLLATITSAMSI